jgi:hypothetical protein
VFLRRLEDFCSDHPRPAGKPVSLHATFAGHGVPHTTPFHSHSRKQRPAPPRPAPTATRREPWFESLPPPARDSYLSRPSPTGPKPRLTPPASVSRSRRRVPPQQPPAPSPCAILLARNGASPNHPRGRPPRCAAPGRALSRARVPTPSPSRARAQAAGSSPAPARAHWRRRVVLSPRHLLRRRRRVGHNGYVCSVELRNAFVTSKSVFV